MVSDAKKRAAVEKGKKLSFKKGTVGKIKGKVVKVKEAKIKETKKKTTKKTTARPTAPSKTPEPEVTTKQEFVKSLTERQEALRAEQKGVQPRKVTVSPTGEKIVIAPESAAVQLALAPTIEQQRRKEAKAQAKREVKIFKGGAVTRTPTGEKVVAVPAREAAEKGEAKILRFEDLTKKEKGEYFKGVIYDPSLVVPSKRAAKARKVNQISKQRLEQYKAIGEAGLKQPVIKKATQTTLLVGTKAKEFAKATDIKIREITKRVIPEKLESRIYQYADLYRGRPSLKEAGVALLETARTREKVEPIKRERQGIPRVISEITPVASEFAGGSVGGLRRQPTKTILTTAGFFVAPPIFKGIGTTLAPVTSFVVTKFPKITTTVSKTFAIALPIAYGTSVGVKAVASPRPFAKFGEITATEIIPMGVGTYLGAKTFTKIEGYIRTLGLKDVEKTSGFEIITPRARSGKLDRYDPKTHLELFREAENPFEEVTSSIKESQLLRGTFKYKGKDLPYPSGFDLTFWKKKYGQDALRAMYRTKQFQIYKRAKSFEKLEKPVTVLHAASGVKRTAISEILREGKGVIDIDTPYDYLRGTFVAPSDKGAAAFLGIGRKKTIELYSKSLLQPYPTPTFIAIKTKGVRARRSIPTEEFSFSGQRIRRFVGKDIPGVVDIPEIKTEPEGVITGGLRLTKERFFVKVRGVRVPIKEFETFDPTDIKAIKKPKRFLQPELKYEEIFEESIFAPESFLIGLSRKKAKLSKEVKIKPSKKIVSVKEELPSVSKISKSKTVLYSSGLSKTSSSALSQLSSSKVSLSSSLKSSVSKVSSPKSYKSSLDSMIKKSSSLISKPSSRISSSVSESSRTSSSFVKSYLSSYGGYSSGYSSIITKSPPPVYPSLTFKQDQKLRQAFDVQLKRFGEFKTVGKALPIGRATRIGAQEAKRTLGATFRLVPAGTTQLRDIGFKPSPTEFRQFEIKKGKKVFTPLQFIQVRGKRLAAGTEVREIQKFQKLAGGNLKWGF